MQSRLQSLLQCIVPNSHWGYDAIRRICGGGDGFFVALKLERTLRQSTEKLYSHKKSLCMLLSRASSSTSCLRPELWFSTSGSQRSLTKSSSRPFWIFLTSSMRSYPTTIPRQWKRKTKEGAVQCKETQGARLERGGNSRHLGPGRRGEGDFGVWGQGIWRGSLVVEIYLCLEIKPILGIFKLFYSYPVMSNVM